MWTLHELIPYCLAELVSPLDTISITLMYMPLFGKMHPVVYEPSKLFMFMYFSGYAVDCVYF